MKRIYESLLDATSDGPATQWNDRIAGVAIKAGLPLYNINWIGSPSSVAQRVARYAADYGGEQEKYFIANFGGEQASN